MQYCRISMKSSRHNYISITWSPCDQFIARVQAWHPSSLRYTWLPPVSTVLFYTNHFTLLSEFLEAFQQCIKHLNQWSHSLDICILLTTHRIFRLSNCSSLISVITALINPIWCSLTHIFKGFPVVYQSFKSVKPFLRYLYFSHYSSHF